jgi:nucleoside phosphorylase
MLSTTLERITAYPDTSSYVMPGSVRWPTGLAPVAAKGFEGSGPLPWVDVVVMTYTSAEGIATADVLSPGVQRDKWAEYTYHWADYEPHLTDSSPAREAKCMAYVQPIMISTVKVMLVKSNLHLSTDDKTIPVMMLVKQIVEETKCKLFVTTGTAGGVGVEEVLGDVVIAKNVKFNLAESEWSAGEYAQQSFPTSDVPYNPGLLETVVNTMIPHVVGDSLKPSGYASREPKLITGLDVETVGYFAFADTDDSYGVAKDDPNAGVEEMDDGCVALAFSQMTSAPQWMSIRNVSDPQMGGGSLSEQKKDAEAIYLKYGYWTTVCSALIVWGVIASMADGS